jgi:hypothetical protein
MPIYEVQVKLSMSGAARLLVSTESPEAAARLAQDGVGEIDMERYMNSAELSIEIIGQPVEAEAARQQRIAAGEETACRVCGCSESKACPGNCWWVEPGLCSACRARWAA